MKENDLQVPLHTQLIEFGKSLIAFFIDSLNLIKTESKLAKQSVKMMFWLFLTFLMFAFCSWLCCLGVLFSALATLGVNASMNFVLLALVNVLLMVGTKYLLRHYRKNLRFNETRQLFHSGEERHESLKKEAANLPNAH